MTSATTLFTLTPAAANEGDPMVAANDELARMARMHPADPDRARLREKIICSCVPVARREAGRFRHTGEPMEDLVQVAVLGLIQAIDRFDPSRSVPFRHFATPTITGELKRHFRDKGWSVRVSRRIQELHHEISRTEPELAQRLGRTPTTADLAEHLGRTEQEILAARSGAAAYSARSLNWRVHGEDDTVEMGDLIGMDDRDLEAVTDRESLRLALRVLPDRSRVLLSMRYVDNLTQTQIAEKIGISQMHVSRLIARALAVLRRHMTAERPLCPLRGPG
ncbi:MAG TPA: SigB/SigF/SigG family RNA polymerase sigma factor [Micromonosporaceae bacterium]